MADFILIFFFTTGNETFCKCSAIGYTPMAAAWLNKYVFVARTSYKKVKPIQPQMSYTLRSYIILEYMSPMFSTDNERIGVPKVHNR